MRRILILALVASRIAATQHTGGIRSIQQALQMRDYSRALALTGEALSRAPKSATLWTLHGMALAGLKREPESLAAYRQALKQRPDFIPALERTAEIEYRHGDPQATETLGRLVVLRPASGAAHGMLAVLAYERGDCETAAPHFTQAGSELDGNRTALDQFGDCLFRLKRPGDSAAVFRRVLEADANNRTARFNLGIALMAARQAAEARTVLLPLAAEDTPESEELAALADACREAGDVACAMQVLRRAAKLYPGELRFYLDLATLAVDHESFDLGLEIVNAGLDRLPRSAPLYSMRGVLHVFLGRLEMAEADFNEATRLVPDEAFGRLGLGVALLSSNRFDQAIQVLREQVKASPGEPLVHYYLAQVLLKKSGEPGTPEFEEAIRALAHALALQPGLARAHYLLAKMHLKLGRPAEAMRELEKAIELDPGNRSATYQLLLLYSQQGRAKEAFRLKEHVRSSLEADRVAEGARKNIRLVRERPAQAR